MIHTQDQDFTLIQADVLDGLRSLEDGSVHCVVTSPPYWGLRDYGTGEWEGGSGPTRVECPSATHAEDDPACECGGEGFWIVECFHRGAVEVARGGRGGSGSPGKQTEGAYPSHYAARECPDCGARRVDQQLGLEETPDLYVARMVEVFREVWRVLRADGTCWVNLGDSYAHAAPSGTAGQWNGSSPLGGNRNAEASTAGQQAQGSTAVDGLKPKDLCGIPWRVAFALQADGWYLRSEIIWAKPNPMPESVTDRPTKAHEQVFLLTRSPRYFFDQEAVREASSPNSHGSPNINPGWKNGAASDLTTLGKWTSDEAAGGRNVRSVWDIATQPYPEAHFATYPEELVRRCVLAGTSERGCCPVCGKPWERKVADTDGYTAQRAKLAQVRDDQGEDWLSGRGNRAFSNTGGVRRDVVTLGWRPDCNHTTDPIPCTVLDPFLGSGTTAYVARKHGRRSIGIELNPAYCDLAARRMQQQSLLV